jgi:hypothetical protein
MTVLETAPNLMREGGDGIGWQVEEAASTAVQVYPRVREPYRAHATASYTLT